MSPAERLLAAADLLDKRAGEATAGPWKYTSRCYITTGPIDVDEADWGPEGHEGLRVTTQQDNNAYRYADAQYIATMHPGLGVALASWLRYEAERFAALTFQHTYISVEGDIIKEPCLAVADLVLAGEQVER